MRWFNNLSIQTKLLTGFGLSALILAGVVAYAAMAIQSNTDDSEALFQDNFSQAIVIQQARYAYMAAETQQLEALQSALAGDSTSADARYDVVSSLITEGNTALAKFRKAETEKDLIAKVDKINDLITQKNAISSRERLAATNGDSKRVNELHNGTGTDAGVSQLAVSADKLLSDLAAGEVKSGGEVVTVLADNGDSARSVMIVVGVIGTIVAIGIGIFLARRIKKAMSQVVKRLEHLEQHSVTDLAAGLAAVERGDLTVTVACDTPKIERYDRDEIGRAAMAINSTIDKMSGTIVTYNAMRDGLTEIVGQVRGDATSILSASDSLREASAQMASTSGEIAQTISEVTRSAESLSKLAQDSAEEVERLAAGSEQLSAAASSNAESARESRDEATTMGEQIGSVASASQEMAAAAEKSRNAAIEGRGAVRQAISSMEKIANTVDKASESVRELGEFGEQIGAIVQTIAEIANQTNLLALNAAIEAARAGEHGRGFAVVADNVQSLAERSSAATKEIGQLIAKVQDGTQEAVTVMAEGVEDIKEGREITTTAGFALESILASVQQAAGQVKQIAGQIQGLSEGTGRIVESASQIANMASDSAEGAQEMASSTSNVTAAIVQVSAMTEQTTASAEQVSASTEEFAAQAQELAATANAMTDLAHQLTEATARFRTAADAEVVADAGDGEEAAASETSEELVAPVQLVPTASRWNWRGRFKKAA